MQHWVEPLRALLLFLDINLIGQCQGGGGNKIPDMGGGGGVLTLNTIPNFLI